MKIKAVVFLITLFVTFISFSVFSADPDPAQFKKYWNQGKAELTRYDLKQARYGEIHQGDAVLIFVTEPFLSDKQVKYESGDKSKAIQVLKLNLTRKFNTGIYPYSLMTSIFTPTDRKTPTLKITTSSQEWCGNTFLQMNLKNNAYAAIIRSYFQEEGDQDLNVEARWLEDDMWTRIRLAPETLPVGDIQIVPGSQYLRLWHKDLRPEAAHAALQNEGKINSYSIEYKNIKRKIKIQFEKEFPYAITAWEETQPGGFSDSALLTTKATRTHTLMLDYWDKHNNADAHYRKELGLTQ